jgi:hypothetical protein
MDERAIKQKEGERKDGRKGERNETKVWKRKDERKEKGEAKDAKE